VGLISEFKTKTPLGTPVNAANSPTILALVMYSPYLRVTIQPATIIPLIALVSDIKGVCKADVTFQITK